MSPQNTLLFNVLPLQESSSSSMFKYQSTFRSNFRGEGGVAAADFHAALQLRLFLLCLVVLYKYSTALIHSRDDVRDVWGCFWISRHFTGVSVSLLVGLLLVLDFTTDFLVSIDNFKSSSTQHEPQYNHITKPRWWQRRSSSVVADISEGFQSILTTIRRTSMRFMQTYMWPLDKFL